MIFSISARYLDCQSCHRKFSAHLATCPYCHEPFPDESAAEINRLLGIWRRSAEEGFYPEKTYWTKFYPSFGGWHHIYAVPFLSLDEVLLAENLMYRGEREQEYIASYRHCDQPQGEATMRVLTWQPLAWDSEKEVYCVGPDEGARSLPYTSFE